MEPTHNHRANLRESYNKYAQEREVSKEQDWKVELRGQFLALLQAEQKQTLLEIGAGGGRDSLFFQEQGLAVTCIDLSPAMVELCRQKGLDAHIMDMADLRFPPASFDAVFAINSLLHLPKVEFPAVLCQVQRVMKPGGLAFIGVYGGYDFEGVWDSDRYEPKRFFSFFTDEAIEREAAKVFEIVQFNRVFLEEGDQIHFQALVLRKTS